MQNIHLIKRSYIRQTSLDTCGLACLGMIFNYSGKHYLVDDLNTMLVKEGGLSLYEMQAVAYKYGYATRSVEMDLNHLRLMEVPCVLHMQMGHGLNHYQVCYGGRFNGKSYEYLMADPARQVYYLKEEELERLWVSKAALYFDSLKMDLTAFQQSPWKELLSIRAFPNGFWIIIPMLTLCSASFGIAMSWVLQKGITDDYFLKTNIFIAVIVLLLLISLFKTLFTFLRQYLLIRLNMAVNQKLMTALLKYFFKGESVNNGTVTAFSIRNHLRDMQKIQVATSEFMATVLSDGSMIFVFLSAIAFTCPLIVLIDLVYLIMIGLVTYRGLAGNSFHIAHLNHISATTENLILKDVEQGRLNKSSQRMDNRLQFHLFNHEVNIGQTRAVAINASIKTLILEVFGTIHVIAVFTVCLMQLQSGAIPYGTFMLLVILSFLISSIVPKICSAMAVIADGADASVQYRSVLLSSRR
jgi:ABC-type bacteriocin/lantibiotic exporter with double-glycine peptidase domain